MIRSLSIVSFAVVLLALSATDLFASHPFHVSRSEIEFNSKRKTLEVALCVWPEDLETAISKMEKKSIDIDSLSESKRDELVMKYVVRTFRFFPGSSVTEKEQPKPAKIRWVGSEIGIKKGWLYFEVDASNAAKLWSIENEMFFELNDDQMNHLEIRNGRKWSSQTISLKTPAVQWSR